MSSWEHPPHLAFSFYGPSKPARVGWFSQWKREVRCHRAGGHWWHVDRERGIGWFCCQCGAEKENLALIRETY